MYKNQSWASDNIKYYSNKLVENCKIYNIKVLL